MNQRLSLGQACAQSKCAAARPLCPFNTSEGLTMDQRLIQLQALCAQTHRVVVSCPDPRPQPPCPAPATLPLHRLQSPLCCAHPAEPRRPPPPTYLQRTNQLRPVQRTCSQATAPLGPSSLFNDRFVSAPQAGVCPALATCVRCPASLAAPDCFQAITRP